MFCPSCGREQTGSVHFCCQCGAALSGASRRTRKLMLSAEDKKIAGVCGGLAEYLEVDSTLVRVGWVLLALAGFGLIGYPLAWLIIPSAQNEETNARQPNPRPSADSASSCVGEIR